MQPRFLSSLCLRSLDLFSLQVCKAPNCCYIEWSQPLWVALDTRFYPELQGCSGGGFWGVYVTEWREGLQNTSKQAKQSHSS